MSKNIKSRRTAPNRASKLSAKSGRSFLSRKIDIKLALFIIIFAALGTYLLVNSRADSTTSYVLADSATNLNTQTDGPRVITESQGNKKNSRVVYVAAPSGQTNTVKLAHQASDAGIYSICATGRQANGGTANLVIGTTVNTSSAASKTQAYKPGTDYVGNCLDFTLDQPGTINIDNKVSGGAWKFAIVAVKLVQKITPTTTVVAASNTYPASRSQTGLSRLSISASSLPVYSGSSTITTDGTVIENMRITKPLTIKANNVVLRKVDVNASGSYMVISASGSGLLIEDSDIHGTGSERLIRLGGTRNASLKHVAIWGGYSGVAVGDNTLIEDSYINPNISDFSGQHTTAIGAWGGTSGVRINRTKLINESTNQSSCISIYPENGANTDWVIENSYISASTAYYALYAGYTPPESPNQKLVFRNNTFVRNNKNFNGYVASWSGARTNGSGGNEYGNVWDNNKDTNGNVIKL